MMKVNSLLPEELPFGLHSQAWLIQAQWLEERSQLPEHSDAMEHAKLEAENVKLYN